MSISLSEAKKMVRGDISHNDLGFILTAIRDNSNNDQIYQSIKKLLEYHTKNKY